MTNVTNEADLQACYLDASDNYTITQDITITEDFAPYIISGYSGTFNGGNYTIINFQITATANYHALISTLSGGTIQNIKFSNVAIDCGGYGSCAAVVGYGTSGSISNCHVLSGAFTNAYWRCSSILAEANGSINVDGCTNYASIAVAASSTRNGGIAGEYRGVMTNCINYGDITGTSGTQYGGVVAYPVTGSISGCTNNGDITYTSGDNIGGVIGFCAGAFDADDCVNNGAISGTSTIGGIAGAYSGDMTGCTNNGTVDGGAGLGGVAGTLASDGNLDDCHNTANVTATASSSYAGGVIGQLYGGASQVVQNCSCTASLITGVGTVGGFVAYTRTSNSNLMENCFTTCDVYATNTAGCFAGSLTEGILINKCYATGNIDGPTSATYMCGFVGIVNDALIVIDNCYCTGTVGVTNGMGTYSAGFAGYCLNSPDIRRSYCTGDVTLSSAAIYCGGFVGRISGGTVVSDCYSTGTVTYRSTQRGLFCGLKQSSTISNCGCYQDGSGMQAIAGVGSVTYEKADPTEWYDATENVYDTGTYVWDFSTPVWYEWSTDYPKFSAEPGPPPQPTGGSAIFFGCHF